MQKSIYPWQKNRNRGKMLRIRINIPCRQMKVLGGARLGYNC